MFKKNSFVIQLFMNLLSETGLCTIRVFFNFLKE